MGTVKLEGMLVLQWCIKSVGLKSQNEGFFVAVLHGRWVLKLA